MSDEQNLEEQKKTQRSGTRSFVKWTLLIVLGLPVAWFAFCEARKTYWDWRVTQMCEKDGGVSIEGTIELKGEDYENLINNFGQLHIPLKEKAPPSVKVIREESYKYLSAKDPVVWRHETVVATHDEVILGRQIIYVRRGGDAVALHESSYRCPATHENLFEAIVHKGGQ